MNDLLQKLAVSKAIMDRHNGISRSRNGETINNIPEVQTFENNNIRYNLPNELISETKTVSQNTNIAPKDRIINSKLPDEIKKLMLENPITPVSPMAPSNSVLSDELVEKASRLMGTKKNQDTVTQTPQSNFNNNELRKMMKEVVKEVLSENGLLTESVSKTNETMVIKVGQHIFEGKISKVKKIK